MEKVDLTELFEAQKKLDEEIANKHNVSYATTRARRCMALLVEIGEFANSTRCFKYWSNKGSEDKAIVLDEYADGLHFFLSLGIDINTDYKTFTIEDKNIDLTEQFIIVYNFILNFVNNPNNITYVSAFTQFLNILPLIGCTWIDLKEAYYKKLDTNYKRQENNY